MKGKKEIKQLQVGRKNAPKLAKAAIPEKRIYYFALAIILLLPFIVYFPALKNGFVWDDALYIINNNLIKDLSWNGIKAIFNNFSSDNYAPLTDLINALQYKINGLSPAAFHFGSLVFHLLNIALVFWFIKLLCNRWDMAAITALFFGIHPMQVESVAWASGGSNLFCAAFFLGSLVAYTYYLRQGVKRHLFISLLFYILSLLSKPVGVVLPVVLLLIDFYKGRKITIRTLLDKAPFFILALGVGILTLLLKNQTSSIADLTVYSFPQRIIFASYGFITYILKLFFPLHLSAFYPYPISGGGDIPIHYYLYALIFLGFATYVIYSLRFSKKIFFSAGFFAVTIFLVIQIIPTGKAIMADRYSYIPSIGIFYLAGEGLNLLWSKKLKWAAIIVLGAYAVFFSEKTVTRCRVWNNDMTLWNDVINQYPAIDLAYLNRGNVFKNENKVKEALSDYNKAIELNPGNADAYNNRGNIFMKGDKNVEATNDFNKAIELNPSYADAYYNRGNVFMNENRDAEAINDFNKAIELNPGYINAYINRGIVFIRQNRDVEAIKDFNKAIELNPKYANAYYNRGIFFMNENRNAEAINDFRKGIELNPKYADAYYSRGYIFMNENRDAEAINDFNKAIELNPSNADAYYSRGYVFNRERRFEEAISSYGQALALRPDFAEVYYNRGLTEFYSDKKDAACTDFKHAASLGYQPAAKVLLQLCN